LMPKNNPVSLHWRSRVLFLERVRFLARFADGRFGKVHMIEISSART